MSVRHDITEQALIEGGFRAIHAGDDYDYAFTLLRNGVAFDLTSAKIWFTIKEDSVESDVEAKLQLDSTDTSKLEITNAAAGQFTVHFLKAETADLEGEWHFDIQVLTGAGEAITWARGRFEFLVNLTRAIA